MSLLIHGHQCKAVSPAVSARGRWSRHLLFPAWVGRPAAIFTAGEAAGISCPAHCVCPYRCPRAKDSWFQSPQGRGKHRHRKSLCGCKALQSHSSIPLALPSLPSQPQGAAALQFNIDFSGRLGLKPGHGCSLRWISPLNDAVIKPAVDHAEPAFPGCDAHPGSQATQLMAAGDTEPRLHPTRDAAGRGP